MVRPLAVPTRIGGALGCIATAASAAACARGRAVDDACPTAGGSDHVLLQVQRQARRVGGSGLAGAEAGHKLSSSTSDLHHGVANHWFNGTWTTGYWDCCKPSCSWGGKGNVDKPVLACDAATGQQLHDANAASVCAGGNAASCPNNKPFAVRPRLSMGFAAAAVSGSSGLTGDANCGQCYELVFASRQHPGGNWGGSHPGLAGKSMVVQVSNIGFDVTGDHSFDIQIPGAGQGIFADGCVRQYGANYSVGDFDCDKRYGGCDVKAGCDRLPPTLRDGCNWRYDWYHWLEAGGQTNNPFVDFRRVQCPSELVAISGSTPLDDADFPALDLDAYI